MRRLIVIMGVTAVGLLAGLACYFAILANLQRGPTPGQFHYAVIASALSGIAAAAGTAAGGTAFKRSRQKRSDRPARLKIGSVANSSDNGSDKPLRLLNLPPRNPNFTGRQEYLTKLHRGLMEHATAALTPAANALHGLGGVGKSQIALEFAYQYSKEYDIIWWVKAELRVAIPESLARLGMQMGLPEIANQEELCRQTLNYLGQRERWLIIYDNVERAADIEDYRPAGGGGHILVTSRNPAWGSIARALEVDVFPRQEALEFLEKRAPDGDVSGANALAEELGDLPLALEQAAAYMEQSGTSRREYLKLFRRHRKALLSKGEPTAYSATVDTTWRASIDELNSKVPAAARLLEFLAFFAPESIPLDLIVDKADELPPELAEVLLDELTCHEAVAALTRYSLLHRNKNSVGLHRLVQAVVIGSLSEADRTQRAGAAVRLMSAAFPSHAEQVSHWPVCARLLPHVLTITAFTGLHEIEQQATATVLSRAGRYLWARAELQQARELLERAVTLDRGSSGELDARLGRDLAYLGSILRSMGDLTGARARLEQALVIDEAAGEANAVVVARDLTKLSLALRNLGDYRGAQDRLERAIAITTASLGDDHPELASIRGHLGGVLHKLGDLDGARRELERAVAISKTGYGPEHPLVALHLCSLADVLRDKGDLSAARSTVDRALSIDQTAYGPEHPLVARDRNSLGLLLFAIGDLTGARDQLERAIAIDEATIGSTHPVLALRRHNLGMVLRRMGDLVGAEEQFSKCLSINRGYFGPDHPKTTQADNDVRIVQDEIKRLRKPKLIQRIRSWL